MKPFIALAEHDWHTPSAILDASSSDYVLKEVVKLLLLSHIRQMPDSKVLARITPEAALDGLRRDITKADGLAEGSLPKTDVLNWLPLHPTISATQRTRTPF